MPACNDGGSMSNNAGGGPGRRVTTCVAVVAGLLWCAGLHAQSGTAPTLDDVLRRMGAFVAGYGEQASLIVAVERYTQRVSGESSGARPPRTLFADFTLPVVDRVKGVRPLPSTLIIQRSWVPVQSE